MKISSKPLATEVVAGAPVFGGNAIASPVSPDQSPGQAVPVGPRIVSPSLSALFQ